MTTINHEELERIAIEMWEKSPNRKAKTWATAKRNHWRKRALPLATLANEPQGIGRTLMRACGWLS